MIKAVFKCMGLNTLPIGIATVLAGIACASLTGNAMPLPAIICLLFALLAQISANLYHRYCDEKHNYGENIDDGISNTQSGDITLLSALKEGATASAIMAAIAGCAIATIAPAYTVAIGILIIAGVYLFNSGPAPLCRLPAGIVIPFLFFGPVGVIGTDYVQVARDFHIGDSLSWDLGPSLWIGITMGLFALNSQLWSNYGMRSRAESNASRSYVVTVGARGVRLTFLVSSLLILAISLFFCLNYHLQNIWWVMAAPVVCTLLNLLFFRLMQIKDESEIGRYSLYVNLNMLLYATAALVEFSLVGIPDESVFHYF